MLRTRERDVVTPPQTAKMMTTNTDELMLLLLMNYLLMLLPRPIDCVQCKDRQHVLHWHNTLPIARRR